MRESLTPPSNPDQNAAGTDHRVPSPLVRTLAVVLLAEAALAVVAAVIILVDLIRLLTSDDGVAVGASAGMNSFLLLCALGLAAGLVAASRALGRGRRSGRAFAMTWQLFQGVVAVSALTSGNLPAILLGVLLLALAVAVVVLLLMPRVVEATTQR